MSWGATDTWIVVIGALCAMTCALLGNYLVLRRMSMMGDAISHAVLPGLAGGFLFVLFLQSNEAIARWLPGIAAYMQDVDPRNPFIMFVGAAVVGLLTALFTEWVSNFGKVDRGAAMGVVFTTLFALGLILIEEATEEKQVDLDASCVLLGALEYAVIDRWTIFGEAIPRAAIILSCSLLLNALFVGLFYKELKISSFDPALATTLGINARLMHYLLMAFVAITTVASFETIGSILVIAMLIVPPAAAYLLTDRLGVMIVLSLVIGAASAALGHLGAITVPTLFGFEDTVTTGSMAAAAGLVFAIIMLGAPRHGVISKIIHRAGVARRILDEDVLGFLFRLEEHGLSETRVQFVASVSEGLHTSPRVVRRALRRLARRGQASFAPESVALTHTGRARAREIVRSHRLWETYLVKHLGLRPDHVHDTAMVLEHITDAKMRERLAERIDRRAIDPHGREIPE